MDHPTTVPAHMRRWRASRRVPPGAGHNLTAPYRLGRRAGTDSDVESIRSTSEIGHRTALSSGLHADGADAVRVSRRSTAFAATKVKVCSRRRRIWLRHRPRVRLEVRSPTSGARAARGDAEAIAVTDECALRTLYTTRRRRAARPSLPRQYLVYSRWPGTTDPRDGVP
jgi:hypothetical protein